MNCACRLFLNECTYLPKANSIKNFYYKCVAITPVLFHINSFGALPVVYGMHIVCVAASVTQNS